MSMLSALVVLHPAEGKLRGDEQITSENYQRHLPAPEDLDAAMAWFRGAGFVVEAPGPTSFSIGADPARFRQVFDSDGGPFDVARLPASLRGKIAAVEVPGPPDFGPGNP
jgi:hypothetical protein